MKSQDKVRELKQKAEAKPTREDEARKTALRIEELEARLAPNAVWGD